MRFAPALRASLVPAATIAAAVALVAWYAGRNELAELAARYQVIDDAFYYLEIANNLRIGCGSSFDCLNQTNGYHPLWLLLLVPITAVLPDAGDPQTWLALAASIAVFGAACVLLTLLARRLMPQARLAPYVPALLLAANPSQFFVVVNGLETPVALLSVVLLIMAAARALAPGAATEGRMTTGAALALAGAGALAFLARLDYALIAAAGLAALLMDDLVREGRPRRATLLAGMAFAAVVAIYLGINLALFDRAMPVSGAIKQESLSDRLVLGALHGPAGAISALFWPLRFVSWPGNPLFLLLAAIPTAIAVAGALRAQARLRDIFLALFGWVHAALYLLLQSSGPEYYFVPLVLSVAWSCAVTVALAERGFDSRGRAFAAIALAVLALAGPAVAATVLDRDRPVVAWRLDRLRAIDRMNRMLPQDARIGSWWSGAVGYYAQLPVINLDGLVNSAAYLEVLRTCRIGPYLLEREIFFLADYMTLDMIERGTAEETLFPGRCWAELWRDLAEAGYRLEPVLVLDDPDHPGRRVFAVLALRRP